MFKIGVDFDPKETEVQIALGSYEEWWITPSVGYYDPPWLPELLDNAIPKRELWSGGVYRCWASKHQVEVMCMRFQGMYIPGSIRGEQYIDGKLQRVFIEFGHGPPDGA